MTNSEVNGKQQYHGLLKEGYNMEKITPLVNAPIVGVNGVKAKPYNEWTKEELYQQAIKAGIPGRSYMNKKNLINSLQNN